MSNKHNPYLRLFTRDIEGSPKVNSLSMEATGLYFRLLNRMTEPPKPGSIALHDWEPHHTWQRSLTQQCLATPDKQDRLQYFAKLLTRYFQWRSKDILRALKELYFYGIIVVEDDRLIQPRLYRDNGYTLVSEGDEKDAIDSATGAVITEDNDDMEDYQRELKKEEEKTVSYSRARVHARHALSNENENNNIVEKNVKEENKEEKKKRRNLTFTPPTLDEVVAYCAAKGYTFNPKSFYAYYEANGWVQGKGKPIKKWEACCVTWQQRELEGGYHAGQRNGVSRRKSQAGVPVDDNAPDKYNKRW